MRVMRASWLLVVICLVGAGTPRPASRDDARDSHIESTTLIAKLAQRRDAIGEPRIARDGGFVAVASPATPPVPPPRVALASAALAVTPVVAPSAVVHAARGPPRA